MVVQNVSDQKKIPRSYFFGLLIGLISLLLISLRDIAVLGSIVDFITLPSFEAVKLVDIANVITRMEVLYAIQLLLLQFFKVSILFYAAIMSFQHIFGLNSCKPFVTVMGVVIISFALTLFDSGMENAYWGSRYAPFYNSFFQLVLPALTLITAYARDLFNMVRSKAH
jgi:spore germination protein KB